MTKGVEELEGGIHFRYPFLENLGGVYEFCQVASKSHHLFKTYDKSAHQPQECHETTHIESKFKVDNKSNPSREYPAK